MVGCRLGAGRYRREVVCGVARRRVVLFNADPTAAGRFWLTRDYLPGVMSMIPRRFHQPGGWVEDYLSRELGPVRLVPVPIPHDCRDGLFPSDV